jgi:hypothetical protein
MSQMPPFTVSLDVPAGCPPDQQEVVVRFADGSLERVRVQDYQRVYAVPGLYEAIVSDTLRCRSPDRVGSMLAQAARSQVGFPQPLRVIGSAGVARSQARSPQPLRVISSAGVARSQARSPQPLRVIDLGAGNGVSGEALIAYGLKPVVAIDIEPAARAAALRDRPDTYDAYLTADILALTPAQVGVIRGLAPNALACVGAIGLDHVPPGALPAALGLLDDNSLLAYTLSVAKATTDAAEICTALRAMADGWRIEELARERYQHRVTVTGEPIWWEAVVVRAVRG